MVGVRALVEGAGWVAVLGYIVFQVLASRPTDANVARIRRRLAALARRRGSSETDEVARAVMVARTVFWGIVAVLVAMCLFGAYFVERFLTVLPPEDRGAFLLWFGTQWTFFACVIVLAAVAERTWALTSLERVRLMVEGSSANTKGPNGMTDEQPRWS